MLTVFIGGETQLDVTLTKESNASMQWDEYGTELMSPNKCGTYPMSQNECETDPMPQQQCTGNSALM